MNVNGTLRVCTQGHRYYKSSDCPTCPVCESEREPAAEFMKMVSAPARRALEREGIKTLKQLSEYSEKELLALHGIGPGAIPKLKIELKKNGLTFRK
jgi:hypothetical protein